jgi:hypothetical protein
VVEAADHEGREDAQGALPPEDASADGQEDHLSNRDGAWGLRGASHDRRRAVNMVPTFIGTMDISVSMFVGGQGPRDAA